MSFLPHEESAVQHAGEKARTLVADAAQSFKPLGRVLLGKKLHPDATPAAVARMAKEAISNIHAALVAVREIEKHANYAVTRISRETIKERK